jgi:hypothetical protein
MSNTETETLQHEASPQSDLQGKISSISGITTTEKNKSKAAGYIRVNQSIRTYACIKCIPVMKSLVTFKHRELEHKPHKLNVLYSNYKKFSRSKLQPL